MPYPPSQEYRRTHPQQQQNGFGVAGFTLGVIGLAFRFIPLVGVVAWPVVIVGVVMSAGGLVRARRGEADNLGMAAVGLVACLVGLVLCIGSAASLP